MNNNTESANKSSKPPVKKMVFTINEASLEYTPSEDPNSLVDGSVSVKDLDKFQQDLNKNAASTGVYRYIPVHDPYANNPYPFD